MNSVVSQAVACSVVIPTFNRAPLLGEAIESVLAQQSRAGWELIVVDDGSTDETPALVARYRDPRIRFARGPHAGRSAARNRGAALAASDRIAFLDSDDRLLRGALEAHLEVHGAEPELGMTVGGYERIDAAGRVTDVRQPWVEGGDLSSSGWLVNCRGIPSAVMVRRSWFDRVGGFRAEHEPAEDWDFFLRLAVAGCPMAWVRESVCEYRQHAENSTRAIDDHLSSILSMLTAIADDPQLPGDAQALLPRARAWAYVSSARTAAALGADGHVRRALGAAREMVRSLSRHAASTSDSFDGLLEPLAADLVTRSSSAAERSRAAKRWGVSARELRRALARVEMSAFFAAVERGNRAGAARHLARGLRRDPRWLTNRGVAGFLLGRYRGHQ